MADARTPAQIEAEIARRRGELALTLDEIASRVSPKAIVSDAKARAVSAVDRTAGRAYVAVNRAVTDVRGRLVSKDGSASQLGKAAPVVLAVAVVAGVGLMAVAVRRRRR
ncbi:DUF3618 domain-containing protein [Streptomyces sp. TP-A0874]|uniref:DUF3618 domain-containing protein n=1 Tax=Streptomyces sp. TP-A0874 TaxID=549819 RepID=UPI000852E507|nr:DUF3618 domain-containing protein [Streptomyces sp. TP-A0874]